MKKLLFFIASLPFAASFLTSCEEVKMEHRFIDIGSAEVTRKVLLEEFTGQECTNCPEAHAAIEKLEEQYGDNFIAVSIHAGPFGIKAPLGLMQPEGDEYANHWGIDSYPAGVLDRNSGVLDYKQFATAVREEIGKLTPVDINLEAKYNEDETKIEITSYLSSSQAMAGAYQLWVVESSIVRRQNHNGVTIPDYVHNNVYRASVNGLWGQNVSLGANEPIELTNEIEVDMFWDTDNLAIVGFFYTSAGVEQVERCGVGY